MKKIVLISSYCDTPDKISVLRHNILKLKSLGLDVMLNSPIIIPQDIINLCDYFFLTKDNPVLKYPEKWVWVYNINNGVKMIKSQNDYGWANLYQVKKLSEIALTFDYDLFYHIIYDLIIDDYVVEQLQSEKCFNFFPFHEHRVSLHLMLFNRDNLLKFISLIEYKSYIAGQFLEQWLWDTLSNAYHLGAVPYPYVDFEFTIEDTKVDDSIFYHATEDGDQFNYSPISGIKFFIEKNIIDMTNVRLYFYESLPPIGIKVVPTTNDDIHIGWYTSRIVDLGYNPSNILDTIIYYNQNKYNITELIKGVIHNELKIMNLI